MSARSSASEQREAYVDRAELARLMKVSTRTIDRFITEGMPSETWGLARRRYFLASECIDWAQRRTQDRSV